MSRDFWCLRYVINDHRIGDNLQMIYKRRVHASRGGVVNQMIKNIVQSKRPRSVKKTRLRINISWIIDLPEVVASSFSKFGHTNRTMFSTAERFPHTKLWNICSLKCPVSADIFSFYPIHSVETVSNFVICYSKLQLLLKIELDLAGFPLCVT